MRQIQQIMGMPVTIDIPKANDDEVFKATYDRLRQIDERFSTYKKDSEVSRFAAGKLQKEQLSTELKEVIAVCNEWEKKTGGYFSAWATDSFDPSGYVKGWAIAEAGKIIEKSGYKTYCIGAGGDILGRSDSEKAWSIGIQDPTEPTKILNKLSISNGAVATSGNYERGTHIINPKTKQPVESLLSVSVVGPDIGWADVLATAVFAMGENGLEFMSKQPDYEVLIIDNRGATQQTPGFANYSQGSNQ